MSNTMIYEVGDCHQEQPQRMACKAYQSNWGFGTIDIENEEVTCSS